MKELKFEMKIEKYNFGDRIFNDNFTYDEIKILTDPKRQSELLGIINSHIEEGASLTGDHPFKEIAFISQSLLKGFLVDMEK